MMSIVRKETVIDKNINIATDVFVVAFIFLNVIAFEFPLFGMPLRYLVLFILFLLSVVCPSKRANKIKVFLFTVFFSYSILATYSLLRGNLHENVLSFIKPLFNLLAIPSFKNAFDRHGVLRYLNAFSLSCIGLIILFWFIYLNPEIGLLFAGTEEDDNIGLLHVYKSELGDGSRIVIKTFAFLVPFSIYVMFRLKGVVFYIFSGFMFVVSVLSQTYGVVIPIALFYLYILYIRKEREMLVLSMSAVIIYGIINVFWVQDVLAVKLQSADVKSAQALNIFKDMDVVSLFLGRGLGCIFTNFDSRQVSETVIEVSSVMVFQMGGLLLMWPILNVYLKPAIDGIKRKNVISKILGYCQIGILISAQANPYIWSGCFFLFMIILVADSSSYYTLNDEYNRKISRIAEINKFFKKN